MFKDSRDHSVTGKGKYEFKGPIGSGAYSVVWKALQVESGQEVAVKKMSNVFRTVGDAKHALREIKLLRHLQHGNIVNLLDVFVPTESPEESEDVYLVFELLTTDLSKVIETAALTTEHVQLFIYQTLCGLKFIHSANVLHRDLKPSNLLINPDCTLKICDFGMGRGKDGGARGREALKMTQLEVCTTRWYRAPEGLVSARTYSSAVDVWSAGCILAELLMRNSLFPGHSNFSMLEHITNYLGIPTQEELSQIESEKYRDFLKGLPPKQKQSLASAFPQLKDADPLALDLVEKMLAFSPERRITVAEALRHPFLETLHEPSEEPDCASTFCYDWEHVDSIEAYRELIHQELTTPALAN